MKHGGTDRAGLGPADCRRAMADLFQQGLPPEDGPSTNLRLSAWLHALLCLLALVLLTGCGGRSEAGADEEDHFYRRMIRVNYPHDADSYVVLEPVSRILMERLIEEHSRLQNSMVDWIEERLGEDLTEEDEGVIHRMRRWSEYTPDKPERIGFWDRIRPGDVVLSFEFIRGRYSDSGVLVLRDGVIVFRELDTHPFGDFDTELLPSVVEIDSL